MRLQSLLISLFSILFMLSSNASAQDGQIGDILNDIFNGQIPGQNDTAKNPYSHVENIPVEIQFDAGPDGLPERAMLIVSAFAPPPPNVRRSAPLLIGETRLLLSGLEAPLQLVIAAPQAVIRTIDYARIEAKIVDMDGKSIFELPNSGEYRGQDAPILRLHPVGFQSLPQPNLSVSETIRGTINLTGDTPNFRGSNLVVRLVEDGLAGGQNRMIIGETRQNLDQQTGPFPFTVQTQGRAASTTPLVFEAWIEDWANRKTHELVRPLPYNGANRDYEIHLSKLGTPIAAPRSDPITQIPASPNTPTPHMPSQNVDIGTDISVRGLAKFNANKGLPVGSILTAVLERTSVRNGTIHTESLGQIRVPLNGLSGDVGFEIPTRDTLVTSNLPTPMVRVQIEDENGKIFFTNASGQRLQHGMNTVNLRATPAY